jgi:hypothetical protein
MYVRTIVLNHKLLLKFINLKRYQIKNNVKIKNIGKSIKLEDTH